MRYGENLYAGKGRRFRAQRAFMRATGWARVLPNFLVIGTPKSGTTSFFAYLIRHPAVFCSLVKEVRFFTREHHRRSGWYRSYFPLRPAIWSARLRSGVRPAVGEGTPAEFWDPRTPARVHALDPEMRLIVLFRDPIDRTHSSYQLSVRNGKESLSFEAAIAAEPERLAGELERMEREPRYWSQPARVHAYVGRSLYAEQLERWFEHFRREQFFIATTEELASDPERVVADAFRFLGLPDWEQPEGTYPHRNTQSYDPIDPAVRERLARLFEEPNRRLYELLGRDLGWTRPTMPASAEPRA